MLIIIIIYYDYDYFVHMAQAGVIWKEGTSVEQWLPSDWSVGNEPLGKFLDDWCGQAQSALSGAITGKMALGCI